jgi:hypothetical protein
VNNDPTANMINDHIPLITTMRFKLNTLPKNKVHQHQKYPDTYEQKTRKHIHNTIRKST